MVEDFMSIRMDIKTKMDSIPTIISDYPTVETAKQCALVAVCELIEEHTWKSPISWNVKRKQYWQQVKEELEKL